MRCPYCAADDDKVVDSRPADEGAAVRRRRECLACGRRFTTYERLEELPLVVVKRSGAVEPFDAEKLRPGIERAVAGSADRRRRGRRAHRRRSRSGAGAGATRSRASGSAAPCSSACALLDPVSSVRFASVYKGFDDLGDFEREVVELQKQTAPKPVRPKGREARGGAAIPHENSRWRGETLAITSV